MAPKKAAADTSAQAPDFRSERTFLWPQIAARDQHFSSRLPLLLALEASSLLLWDTHQNTSAKE